MTIPDVPQERIIVENKRLSPALWSVVIIVAVLPIALLSVYAFLLDRDSIRDQVDQGNQFAAKFGGQMIHQEFEANLSLVRMVARGQTIVQNVTDRDVASLRARLGSIADSNAPLLAEGNGPRLDRLYVADPDGTVWCDYPQSASVPGENISSRDWFEAVAKDGQPTISAAQWRSGEAPIPMVCAAMPIINAQGRTLAVLVAEYSLDQLATWVNKTSAESSEFVFVIDPRGALVALPGAAARQDQPYAGLKPVADALAGQEVPNAIIDDPISHTRVVASFEPVQIHGRWWVVGAEQPYDEAYFPIRQIGMQILLASGCVAGAAVLAVSALATAGSRNRRLAQEVTRRNQELRQFEAIVDASDDAILSTTPTGTLRSWNPAAQSIYGYDSSQVVGQPISMICPPGQFHDLLRAINRVATTLEVQRREDVHRRADGRAIEVSLTLSPVRAPADPTRAIAVAILLRDVTARNQAEKERGQFFVASHDLLCAIGFDGLFKRVNPAWQNTLGYCEIDLASRHFLDLVHPDDVNGVADQLERGRQGDESLDFETRCRAADGSYRYFLWSATPHAPGQVIYATGRDVTVRKRIEAALAEQAGTLARQADALMRQSDALRRQAAELERSNAELEQFAYIASHDLQEPLRMVSGFLQLLARRCKGRLDAAADEYIEFAVDGAGRMKTLIEDLLAYSRVGTRATTPQPVDCAEAMRLVAANLRTAIEETHGDVAWTDLPTVQYDPTQLVQLLQNLVANAVKFHGPANPRVLVSARRQEQAWLFGVADNGIGIDSQYFERIFMIFQRLHARDEYPGTGIGLAVCKKIVERHGGRIWVESTPGQGSTFYFTIPDPPGDASRKAAAASGGAVAAAASQSSLPVGMP